MAISLTRLSGGNTPADGSDPRTFPAIWNASATAIEGEVTTIEGDITTIEGDVTTLENTKATIVNTDGDAGITIYVGSVDPDGTYTLAEGDIWIETPSGS